jgi:hypothetical protein
MLSVVRFFDVNACSFSQTYLNEIGNTMTTSIRNSFVLTLLGIAFLVQGCGTAVSPDNAEIDAQSVKDEVEVVKGASQSLPDIFATNTEPSISDDATIDIDVRSTNEPELVKPEPVEPEPVEPELVKPEPVEPEPVKPIEVTTDITNNIIDVDSIIPDITTPQTLPTPSFPQPQNEEVVVIQTTPIETEEELVVIPPTIIANTPPQPIPVITRITPPIPPQVQVMPQDTTVITTEPEIVQTYTIVPVMVYPNCYIARYNHTKIVPFILVQPGSPLPQPPVITQPEPQTELTYKYYAIPMNPIPAIPPIVSVPYMLPQQPSKPFPPRRMR